MIKKIQLLHVVYIFFAFVKAIITNILSYQLYNLVCIGFMAYQPL